MRVHTTLAILLACMLVTLFLLACSQFSDDQDFEESGSRGPYLGETSLEERIANYPTIVRGTLDRVTSEAVAAGGDGYGKGKYVVVVKFHITVSEYLSGTGANSITAVWGSEALHDSRGDAEAAMPALVSKRDTSFDDREAIFFMKSDFWELYAGLKGVNTYFTEYVGEYWYEYPFFDVNDRYNRLLLPAVDGGSGTGDDQEFLLALPEPSSTSSTPTITLGALKAKIAAVNAELNEGDGSEAYKECVRNKQKAERITSYVKSQGRENNPRVRNSSHSLASGASADTMIYEDELHGYYPDQKFNKTWLDGGDAALFEIVDGPTMPKEWDHDGVLTPGVDHIEYTQSLKSKRPLPGGEYTFNIKDQALGPVVQLCNETSTYEWAVTVTSPSGALHEFLFDPVTVGSAVVADASNGVLNPASFTGADGATATVESISYESPSTGSEPAPGSNRGQAGKVRVKVVPWDVMSGHVLDFIGLDGAVSLSLNVANSAVDDATDTLTWSVSSQPWEDGDRLMGRIRRAAPFAPAPHRLISTNLGRDSISLSWDSISGVTGYVVESRVSGDPGWETVDPRVKEKSHTVPDLSCGTSYEFRVGAYGDGTRYETVTGPRTSYYATVSETTDACSTQ